MNYIYYMSEKKPEPIGVVWSTYNPGVLASLYYDLSVQYLYEPTSLMGIDINMQQISIVSESMRILNGLDPNDRSSSMMSNIGTLLCSDNFTNWSNIVGGSNTDRFNGVFLRDKEIYMSGRTRIVYHISDFNDLQMPIHNNINVVSDILNINGGGSAQNFDVAADDNIIISVWSVSGSSDGIFVSKDGGNNFSAKSSGIYKNTTSVSVYNGKAVLVADNKLLKISDTSDFDNTIVDSLSQLNVVSGLKAKLYGDNIIIFFKDTNGDFNTYVSKDFGSSWIDITDNMMSVVTNTSALAWSYDFYDKNIIVTSLTDVLVSTDLGNTWINVVDNMNIPVDASGFKQCAISDDTMAVGYTIPVNDPDTTGSLIEMKYSFF